MNDANLTFTTGELAILTLVVGHAVDQPIKGVARLRQALKDVRPDLPFHFTAAELAAADAAFRHVAERGLMPSGLGPDEQDAYHHVKATIAAAVVD